VDLHVRRETTPHLMGWDMWWDEVWSLGSCRRVWVRSCLRRHRKSALGPVWATPQVAGQMCHFVSQVRKSAGKECRVSRSSADLGWVPHMCSRAPAGRNLGETSFSSCRGVDRSLKWKTRVWLWNWHTTENNFFFRTGGTQGSRLPPQNAGMPQYQVAGAGMLTTKRRTTAAPKEKKGSEKESRPPAQNRADNEPVLNVSNVSSHASHATESPC
jgi:hypothetical protein